MLSGKPSLGLHQGGFVYKRFWLGRMAPRGLAQEKRSVCINTGGQNVIRTISLLALLPGLSRCLQQVKALWSVPRALPALEQADCSPAVEVGGVGSALV